MSLIELSCAAETEIFYGSPNARHLMTFITVAAEGIAELAPAYDVLQYANTHGPGPYEDGELSDSLPHDRASLDLAVDRLASQGILCPRAASA